MSSESRSLPSLTAALDLVDDPISIFTREGKYLYINEAGQTLIGRRASELLGRTYLDVFPDLVGTTFDLAFRRVAAGDVKTERLHLHYEPMGTWSEQQILRVDDEHVIVLWRDVTKQEKAALAQSKLVDELAENERLLEESLARAEAVTHLASSLSVVRTTQEVAAVIIEEGKRAFAADQCTLYSLSDGADHLDLIGERGVAPALAEQIARIPLAIGDKTIWSQDEKEYAALIAEVAASRERRAKAFWSMPLIAEGVQVGLLGMGFASFREFPEQERAMVRTFTQLCAQALLRAKRLERETANRVHEERERIQTEFIAAASIELASSLDYRSTLATVARLAVPELADWCGVELLEPGNAEPQQVAVAHIDPAKLQFARELSQKYPPDPNAQTGAPNVIRTGKSELYPEIPAGLLEAAAKDAEHMRLIRELDLTSAMVVPLRYRERTFGAVSFIYTGQSRRYDEADLAFAEDFAQRAATAIENARVLKQVEEARRLLDTVIENMPSGLTVLNPKGEATLVNRRANELYGGFGFPTNAEAGWIVEVAGAPVPNDDRPIVRSLRGEKSDAQEVRLTRPDNKTLTLNIRSAPLLDAIGKVVGAIAVFDDISAQKQADDDRLQNERFRELFIGMLGHDLRNPLSAITMGANMLGAQETLSPENTRIIARIQSSSARMARMIDQILDFTRARNAGGIPVTLAVADAHVVLANVIAEFHGTSESRIKITVTGRTSGNWDSDRLAQVFSNLIGNALEHADGPVNVDLEEKGDALRMTVHNGGAAIPEADLSGLFDPFRQSDRPGKKRRGLGLGLYISRQIMIAHGGSIEVRSTADEGTTFVLNLPYERGV